MPELARGKKKKPLQLNFFSKLELERLDNQKQTLQNQEICHKPSNVEA